MTGEAAYNAGIVQVALAEFSALRSEILSRTSQAWMLVSINFTVTAAVLGVLFSKEGDRKLLLVLPLIAPSLSLLFIDHSFNIRSLGGYIRKRIRPLLAQATGSANLLGYEDEVSKYEQNRFLRTVPFGLPLLVIFTAVPAASLVFAWSSLEPIWSWTAWWSGLVLVVAQFIMWCLFIFNPQSFNPFQDQ